jgi:hypothetical protein
MTEMGEVAAKGFAARFSTSIPPMASRPGVPGEPSQSGGIWRRRGLGSGTVGALAGYPACSHCPTTDINCSCGCRRR